MKRSLVQQGTDLLQENPVSKRDNDEFDPGSSICGHGPREVRVHYLGGGLWVCFECLVKMFGCPTRGTRV